MHAEIRAVLFDSGDTLLRPIGGAWWPSPGLLRMLGRLGVQVDPARLAAALEAGMRFLEAHHDVRTEAEEIDQFTTYYSIIFDELSIPQSHGTVGELARGGVVTLAQEPFPDTQPMLEELRGAKIRMGIVSNAWPSLERTYRALGLRHFFHAFVISSKLGCLKPDPRIYHEAIRQIGAEPSRILFVDDDAEYVRAAKAMGMRGAVMCRYGAAPAGAIATLAELRSRI